MDVIYSLCNNFVQIYTVSGKKRVYSILCVTLTNLKIFS